MEAMLVVDMQVGLLTANPSTIARRVERIQTVAIRVREQPHVILVQACGAAGRPERL